MFITHSPEVKLALIDHTPIIALESTIIAHGMPYPQNLQTALHLEDLVRKHNCCPATIYISEGKIRIGVNEEEIRHLATADNVLKASTKDLPRILIEKQTAATTVAATMFCAHLAGIKVFATGGIGGVHRNADKSFDISADLQELSKTPLIVVSAGAKAILDLGKTLEYLETAGVPVYGYNTEYFPGFYFSETPWKIDTVNNAKLIADIYRRQKELGLSSALLIANPVPKQYDIPWLKMDKMIDQALSELDERQITGKSVTPFLLKRIADISQGKSLESNIALVKNNVVLACEIAAELVD